MLEKIFPLHQFHIEAAAKSRKGTWHTQMGLGNEDAYGVFRIQQKDRKGIVAVVADGMSSTPNSRQAADAVIQVLSKNTSFGSLDTPGFKSALLLANEKVIREQKAAGDERAAVAVAVLLSQTYNILNAHIGHMGDARAYLLRRKKLESLTKDHTEGYFVTKGFGMDTTPTIHLHTLEGNETLLLCSDGIYRFISRTFMENALQQSAKKAVNLLIEASEKGDDDATVLVLKIFS